MQLLWLLSGYIFAILVEAANRQTPQGRTPDFIIE